MLGKRFLIITAISISILATNSAHLNAFAPKSIQEDAVEFTQPTYAPNGTAAFLIRDSGLNTRHSCLAVWIDLVAPQSHESFWNLTNGEPQPSAYAGLDEKSCLFDINTPSNTPLASVTPKLDGIRVFLDDAILDAGLFSINSNITSDGQDLEVTFEHEIIDKYPASQRRALVTSTSDPLGEWSGFTEVSEVDSSRPNPTSHLFKGEVNLSSDEAALGQGDGIVLVKLGDTVSVDYMESGGSVVISSDQSEIAEPTPTPTPIPSMNMIGLVVLAIGFVVVFIWGFNKKSKASGQV